MSILNLLLLFIVAFIQNAVFTFVSRSRNSGNPNKHFYAAIASNGIWFVCNFFLLFPEMLKIAETGSFWQRLILLFIYVIPTSLGSVFMMKINLGHIPMPKILSFLVESGKSKVGSTGAR